MPRQPIHDSTERAAELAEVLKALGHPLRLRLISLLAEGELHVNALAERLAVPQAIVSQQLRILRMSGLVAVNRGDGRATYRLAEPQLLGMLECMGKCAAATHIEAPQESSRRRKR